jgi:hypothetical protein
MLLAFLVTHDDGAQKSEAAASCDFRTIYVLLLKNPVHVEKMDNGKYKYKYKYKYIPVKNEFE